MRYHRIRKVYLGVFANIYVLDEDFEIRTEILGVEARTISLRPAHITSAHITKDGLITIRAGFVWDGPSGPTIDSPSSMRASLAHDILYAFIRAGAMKDREAADKELYRIAVEDGMWCWRASMWYYSLRAFGRFAV